MLPLHSYQSRAIDLCISDKTVFLAADVGLGKTRIILETIQRLKKPAIVLAPLRVCYHTWPEQIKEWTPDLKHLVLHGPDKKDLLEYKTDIYLLNYDGIKWFYQEMLANWKKYKHLHDCILVCDESSMIKSHSTMRFKLIRKLLKMFPEHRYCLSATPAPNGYIDLWSQYYTLDSGEALGAFFSHFRDVYFTYLGPPTYKCLLKHQADKAIEAKIAPLTFRLAAKDYLELPEFIQNTIYLELPDKLYKQYKELEREFLVEIEGTQFSAVTAAALSMKLRQFIQGGMYNDSTRGSYTTIHNLKLQALDELIDGSNAQPILCPIQFKFELDMLRKRFGKIAVIAGGTSAADSMHYLNEWNAGNLPLLVCHPASLSHGVNLQAGGRIICWFGLTWNLEHYKQLNGRLLRQGQKHAVIANHLVIRGTVDELVMKALKRKDTSQECLLDALREYSLNNKS